MCPSQEQEDGEQVAYAEVRSEQETEADLTGLQLLQREKIDSHDMTTFFQRLSEKDEGRVK